MLKVIDTKKGGKSNRTIKKRTGKLRNSLKPILSVKGDGFELSIEAMDYYKFLDTGSKNIKPWFLTKELTGSKEFKDIIEKCYQNALRNTINK